MNKAYTNPLASHQASDPDPLLVIAAHRACLPGAYTIQFRGLTLSLKPAIGSQALRSIA
jgi:hypothetical protein